MQKSSLTLLTIVILAAFVVQQIAARCNVCNEHGIACIGESSFQLCFNGVPDRSQEFPCPDSTICVDLAGRCMPRNPAIKPACELTSSCNKCDGLNMFTCTSRTTFVQCNGTEPLPGTGHCPAGLTCDSRQAEICVNECRAPEEPMCNNDVPL